MFYYLLYDTSQCIQYSDFKIRNKEVSDIWLVNIYIHTHTMHIPQNMFSLYKSVHRVRHGVVLHSVTSHPGMWCLSASNHLLPVGFPIYI
jgi:hypothetical protein